ncbi:MAG: tRNA (adenosine(37)-N6)-dimethylallyltransferase MiaA [Victivallales bacterium]
MKIIIISGPTASGKSEVALEIARRLSGEIVSADSMQLYKGLDIGAAKPGKGDTDAIPHHLIDVFDISERLDVFRYVELADKAICEIRSRGNLPIISGGTGMYIRALLHGLDPLPSNAELRTRLDIEFDNDAGFEKLKGIMAEKDPRDLQRWRQHRRKLIRAMEVFELTGKSITELQKTWKDKPSLRYDVVARTLVWDRDLLKQRISLRTDRMLESGWIDEARAMISRGLLNSPTAHQALGYKIIAEHLDGMISFERMRERIITETWQFARRQITWFKNQSPESLPMDMPANMEKLIDEIMKTPGTNSIAQQNQSFGTDIG